MMKYLCLVVTLLLGFSGFSKIDPPNYDFSLNQFEPFMPEQKYSDLVKVKGEGAHYSKSGRFHIKKYLFKNARYVFPLFVQVDTENDLIKGFYVRLPQYFLHNIFHQSLINKFGKQDKYNHVESVSMYRWEKQGIKMIYSGTCTITCFPIYLTRYKVLDKKNEKEKGYKPITEYLSFTN